MDTKLRIIIRFNRLNSLRRALFTASLLAIGGLLGQNARAQVDSWSSASATAWTNAADWSGGVPTSSSDAFFNITMTGSPITINPVSGNTQPVGEVSVGTSESESVVIRNLSGAPAISTLELYGVGGILLSNGSTTEQLEFENTTVSGATTVLNLGLENSGDIYANTTASAGAPPTDATGGEIAISTSVVTGPGSITNIGPGILEFGAANTYTGSTTLNAGVLELGGSGVPGTGTIYLSGGNLESGGSRTTSVPNPIMMTTTAYIYSLVASAGTRLFPLSGSLTGTGGTLIIGNPDATANEVFDVQLFGSFTFNQPLVAGDNLGDHYSDNPPYDVTALQLANYLTNGVQTFNGNISGDAEVYRGSMPNVAAATGGNGITIFTGNNSYTGGTVIDNGALFANNTSGSALGTGSVTVTNQGILAGNGTVSGGASVSVCLNGTVQPGSNTNTIGTLSINSGLTFSPGANYTWQISSVTGVPGTAWDLITCANGWTDGGNNTTPITININSEGLTPTGWNDADSYSWIIISNNGSSTGFTPSDWTVNTTAFNAPIAGVFGVTTDANGDLVLTYTPTSGNIIINVPTGQSVSQGGVSPTPYPVLTGLYSVTKVGNGEVIMTNSLNSYEGETYVNEGTASAAVNSSTAGGAFGASTAPISLGDPAGNSNATLNIDVPGVAIANAVTVQSGSSGVKTIGTTTSSGFVTNSGNVTLNDNVTLSVATGGSDTFSGNFSGAGGITFAGGGTVTMSGVGSYSGTTTVSLPGGSLDLNASIIGTNTITLNTISNLDNTSGGEVVLLNNPPEIWNTSINFIGSTAELNLGAGPVTMNTNCTLTVNGSELNVGGTIAGAGFGLTKAGAGELFLGGSTSSTYTGGTTNLAGILAINATATFGNGAGPLVLAGGNLLAQNDRSPNAIANPVIINNSATPTRFYGNSTDTAAPLRVLPFTGPFTVTTGSTQYVDNVGSGTTTFDVRLIATNSSTSYANINWPIVVGDPSFDTANTTSELELQNDDTTPTQIVSSVISGTGQIARSAAIAGTGGTTILTEQNTFSGGAFLLSGAIGLGASSITSSGEVVSGPLGTGTFSLGEENDNDVLTVFATTAGLCEIDNNIFFDGDPNLVFAGTNNLLFTGTINPGGIAKTLTIENGVTTFSGTIADPTTGSSGNLIEAGPGTLVLSGSSSDPGTNAVNAGTLLVNGSIANFVAVNASGTLGGTGTISGNVSFASGAQAYLYKTAGSPDSPLTISGNLALGGNTVIVDLGGTTTLGPGTYDLINYSGTPSGSFSPTPTIVDGSLEAGYGATISVSTPNEVTLVVAVSSSTPATISSVTVSGGNLILSGSGGTPGDSYSVLTSTNLLLPLGLWAPAGTGAFNDSGDFNYTNPIGTGPQQFFIIKQ